MPVPSPATFREPSTFGIADTLVSFGGEIKALDDNGMIGGYLVRFGSADSPDVSRNRDFFTSDTDFGLNVTTKTAMIWNHGLDPIIEAKHEGGSCLGVGDLTRDDVGVWVEHQLNLRDDYERKMFEMVKAGKLGYSSGTAAHRVRRERQGNGTHHIKVWPLGADASLTPTPADPYLASAATSLKSLVEVKAMMSETGTGFAPPNPRASLRRSAVLGGLSRMRDLTDASVTAHLFDDQLSHEDRLAACSDCYNRHTSSAVQLIGAMLRDGDGDGDGDDDRDEESLKSVWIEHVKSALSHLTLTDQVDAVQAAVDGLVSRLTAYAALKSADGRLVPVRRVTEFEAFRDTLSALVQAARPKPDDDALITQGLAALSRAGLALHGVD